MATLVLENIATLVTVAAEGDRDGSGGSSPASRLPQRSGEAMGDIGVIRDAVVAVDGEHIEWVGRVGERTFTGVERIDCTGRTVMPGFVDSHTHMLFSGDRSNEFARRLRGASYQEIAAEGGGILSTMNAVREASVEDLVDGAIPLVRSAMRHGTTTVEIKSGYGLSLEAEIKVLEAIKELDGQLPIDVVATFMAAHDFPPEFRSDRDGYIEEVIEKMIPAVAQEGLATFCDVFTDEGYFTVRESERIIEAARQHGLAPRVHADELAGVGAAAMAAHVGAYSADHLLQVSDAGIKAMADAGVVATLLPGTAFFLGLPYAPARRMINAGLSVAVATDCNPGTNMCENMQMALALACMGMYMTIEEAITGATLNGAAALGISEFVGSIETGKRADLLVLDVADYPALVYHYGINHVERVIKRGIELQ